MRKIPQDKLAYWNRSFCTFLLLLSILALIGTQGTSSTVSKAAIETVLGLGQTALNEAIQMTRILSIYYDKGPHRSKEVVQMVETTAGTADKVGAEALKKFLIAWEKDHPISS